MLKLEANMGKYDTPKYDEPRRWIQKKFEKGEHWDNLRKACKENDDKLTLFLEDRVIEDDWPPMTIEEWKALVAECEDYASRQENIRFRGNDGALFNTTQDNGLKIPENERSCWQLYKKSLKWKKESINDLEEATIGILRRLSIDTTETGPIHGLVIGHVQSGKTANMEALMAMAADHGWNMFIVLSGSIESLRLQTLKRMYRDLNQEGNLIWRGIEHPSKHSQYGERAQDFHFEPTSQTRYVTVCLKNASRLKDLIEWIHADRASHNLMKILLIDDEADQASISNNAVEYRQEQKERKGINKLIVNIVNDEHFNSSKNNGHVKAMNYVMYTATPYANFLNESTPDSLYPSNFIWTLKTSDEYIGPNQIFGFNDPDKADGLDIKREVTEEDLDRIKDIYDGNYNQLPESMKDAICWFICAAATMRYWLYKKPVSMLVHTSQKQSCHEDIANAISNWINKAANKKSIYERCEKIYKYETERITKQEWVEQFKEYGIPEDKINDYPAYSLIEDEVKTLINNRMQHIKRSDTGDFEYHKGLHLVIDNCSKNRITSDNEYVRLAYPDPDMDPYPSPAPVFIIVGGSTLSRGLTIEGLVSTFFLRASCQADTLMQMGRWFGYRQNYELLPRIWMTPDTMNKFRFLSELEVELRDDLKKYMLTEVTPLDYGPRILCSPKVSWLRLTSKKHMTNAKPAEMDFSGAKPQTVIFDQDEKIQRNNIKITEEFLEKLGEPSGVSFEGTAIYWKDINMSVIMNNLLFAGFSFSNRSRVFNEIETFCEWIKKIEPEDVWRKWNVIIAGNDKVVNGESCDQKHWCVAGKIVGKVNRSRRKLSYEAESYIDIGALRSLRDLIADVPSDIAEQYIKANGEIRKQEQVDDVRKLAGLDKTPLLLIYRIDGKSTKRVNSDDREDMNMPCDIIGLQVCIPGDQVNKKYCKKMTIKLPESDKEDTVEAAVNEN